MSFWLLVLTHLVYKSLYRRRYLEFPRFKTALKSQLHFPSCRRVSRCKKLITSWAWRRATMVSTPVPDLTSIMVEHITWPLDWCTRSYQAVRQTLCCLYLHGSSFFCFFHKKDGEFFLLFSYRKIKEICSDHVTTNEWHILCRLRWASILKGGCFATSFQILLFKSRVNSAFSRLDGGDWLQGCYLLRLRWGALVKRGIVCVYRRQPTSVLQLYKVNFRRIDQHLQLSF